VSAPAALEEYLREHGFGRVAKRLSASGVIDVVSTAAPGIDDIVVLGRIKQLERSGEWDLVIVDGPAAGHAVTMLTSAAGLRDAVTGGPIRAQADDVFALLHDAERCQVILVTMAETTPVSEAIETADALRHRVGVTVAGIVVNAVDTGEALDPAAAGTDDVLASAAHFRLARRAMQDQAIARLSDELPIAQWWVPLVGAIGDGERAIDELAARVTPRL
jgi:anion-transporting  ArsA/GET3 family ATPase